ncbi:MAG: hypothetical protein Q4A69_02650 [Moraxella sp.]|nr:hypothetical protein [Moraxella sp.]
MLANIEHATEQTKVATLCPKTWDLVGLMWFGRCVILYFLTPILTPRTDNFLTIE